MQLWRERGCSYQAALALGDSEDRLALRQALDELRALGAWPAATMVARRLRELGERSLPRGPRPRTRANPAGHHVSAILRKLGVRSRMQAAAEAARLGIGDGLGTRDEPARLGIGDGLGTRDEPANGHASRS